MVKTQSFSTKSSSKTVKCAICHNDINDFSVIYQPQFNLGVVCAECCQRFSDQDIELILSLFIIYGGYFGKLDKYQFSLMEELQNRINHGKTLRDREKIDEINLYLLYRALIHGISPEGFLKRLTNLLKDSEYDYFL